MSYLYFPQLVLWRRNWLLYFRKIPQLHNLRFVGKIVLDIIILIPLTYLWYKKFMISLYRKEATSHDEQMLNVESV